jgi:hypothetical protein
MTKSANRTKLIKLRVTEDERNNIRQCVPHGTTLSKWARSKLLNQDENTPHKRTASSNDTGNNMGKYPCNDPALVLEVARIGNNLNQLARAVNRSGQIGPGEAAGLLAALQAIAQELEQLERR